MKDLDRYPEDLPDIPVLYDASAFCVLEGSTSMLSLVATATAHTLPLGGAPSLFSMMALNIMASMSVPTIPTILLPAAPGPAPLPVNQPLSFAPRLRPEEFSTMIATTIADKLGAMLNGN